MVRSAPRVSNHEAAVLYCPSSALKASRKTSKLQELDGVVGYVPPCPGFWQRPPPPLIWIFPGFSVDDGPGNKAPRDAGRGAARSGAGRPDRLELAAQPRRVARGGGSANPRRDRA